MFIGERNTYLTILKNNEGQWAFAEDKVKLEDDWQKYTTTQIILPKLANATLEELK